MDIQRWSNLKSGSQIKTRTTVIYVIFVMVWVCSVSWSPTAECLSGGPLQTRREDRDSWHNPPLGGMSVVIIHTQLWRRRPDDWSDCHGRWEITDWADRPWPHVTNGKSHQMIFIHAHKKAEMYIVSYAHKYGIYFKMKRNAFYLYIF